jgi:hypothetical protein
MCENVPCHPSKKRIEHSERPVFPMGWMGSLSRSWLRGVDLNHRPLGYEWRSFRASN